MLEPLLQKYMDENKLYHLEGSRGVKHVAQIVEVLGYNDRYSTSSIHAFLEDNPGAQQALIDWIGEQNSPEWKEALESEVGPVEDEDEAETCPKCGAEWSGTSCGVAACGWIYSVEE